MGRGGERSSSKRTADDRDDRQRGGGKVTYVSYCTLALVSYRLCMSSSLAGF